MPSLTSLSLLGKYKNRPRKLYSKLCVFNFICLLWEAKKTMADGIMAISGRLRNLMLLKRVSRCARVWSKVVCRFEMQGHQKGKEGCMVNVVTRSSSKDKMGRQGLGWDWGVYRGIDADEICSLSATTFAAEVAEDSLARLGSLARGGQVG